MRGHLQVGLVHIGAVFRATPLHQKKILNIFFFAWPYVQKKTVVGALRKMEAGVSLGVKPRLVFSVCFLFFSVFCFFLFFSVFFCFFLFFSVFVFICFFLFLFVFFVFRVRVFFLLLVLCRWIARPSWCAGFNGGLKSLHLLFQIREPQFKEEENAYTRKTRRWNEK